MRRLWLSIVVLISLVGCASSKLASEQRSSIKRVSIAEVKMPEKPTILGESSAFGFLLGGPLGVALSNAGSNLPNFYSMQLKKSDIDIAKILTSDLTDELRRQGFDVVAQGQSADAVLHPLVIQYGLTGDPFSSPPVRVPQMWLRVDLKKPRTDENVWWNQGAIHIIPDAMKKLEARRIDDFFQDGELLRREVKKASQLATREALSKL